MQFKCIFEKDTFRKELDKSVIDSLDDNFQLVTDCSCKQMHNLFPTVDNSDDQEFVRFQSMARSSSPCSNAGLKCDQEEKQNGVEEQVRFGAFRRQHVTLNRRAVCNATQVISYILYLKSSLI